MSGSGTFAGLSPATAHVVDAVHVDAHGNVSNVISSAPFTTAAAPALATTFLAATGAGYSAFAATHVFDANSLPGLPADLEGRRIVMGLIDRNDQGGLAGVTVGGTAAALRVQSTVFQRVHILDAVGGAGSDEIVVTLDAGGQVQVAFWETTGTFRAGAAADGGPADPLTLDLSMTAAAGHHLVGAVSAAALNGPVFTGMAQRGPTVTVNARDHAWFDRTEGVAGGAPETFGITQSGAPSYGYAAAAIYG
jgi:hypothetical protein